MVSRRGLLAGTATVASVSLAGCLFKNTEVVNTYTRGYEAYHDATDKREEERFEEAIDEYDYAAAQFRAAEREAEREIPRQYCYEAYVVAKMGEAKTWDELDRRRTDDSVEVAEVFEPDNGAVLVTGDRCIQASEYELRKPDAVNTQTRLPTRLGELAK